MTWLSSRKERGQVARHNEWVNVAALDQVQIKMQVAGTITVLGRRYLRMIEIADTGLNKSDRMKQLRLFVKGSCAFLDGSDTRPK